MYVGEGGRWGRTSVVRGNIRCLIFLKFQATYRRSSLSLCYRYNWIFDLSSQSSFFFGGGKKNSAVEETQNLAVNSATVTQYIDCKVLKGGNVDDSETMFKGSTLWFYVSTHSQSCCKSFLKPKVTVSMTQRLKSNSQRCALPEGKWCCGSHHFLGINQEVRL